jgi:putative oxidoreductase
LETLSSGRLEVIMSSAVSVDSPAPSRALHYGLWTAQILLALLFLGAGLVKSTQPLDVLAQSMPWVGYSPGALVRFVGISEILGAIGLVAPAATRVLPWLTPLAAAGIVTIMALAIPMHATHGELGGIPVNLAIGAMAAFVTWGRVRGAPIGR